MPVGSNVSVLRLPAPEAGRIYHCFMPSHHLNPHTTSLAQALQGDSAFVESTVQTLLQRCLKGAKYGDRCAHISHLFLLCG